MAWQVASPPLHCLHCSALHHRLCTACTALHCITASALPALHCSASPPLHCLHCSALHHRLCTAAVDPYVPDFKNRSLLTVLSCIYSCFDGVSIVNLMPVNICHRNIVDTLDTHFKYFYYDYFRIIYIHSSMVNKWRVNKQINFV